tara:strand:+ start:53914 stop:54123 length:210 start_codon:yes stop_codon:yes gene_type:complete
MTPLPEDPKPQPDRSNHRFWFNLVALFVGAVLLVVGGLNSDAATQTAGGAIVATAVTMIGWQKFQAPKL